jgi:hypothetical protein
LVCPHNEVSVNLCKLGMNSIPPVYLHHFIYLNQITSRYIPFITCKLYYMVYVTESKSKTPRDSTYYCDLWCMCTCAYRSIHVVTWRDRKGENPDVSMYLPSMSYGINTAKVFSLSHLLIFSDGLLPGSIEDSGITTHSVIRNYIMPIYSSLTS